MTSPELQDALLRVVSILLQMIIFGMIAAWLWAGARLLGGRPLLEAEPFGPRRRATWGPGTLLALLILYIVAQVAASAAYRGLVGVDLREASTRLTVEMNGGIAVPGDAGRDDARARRAAVDAMHLMGWNATFNAMFLAAFPWVFRRVSGASLADLGLVRGRIAEQIQAGIVAALLVTPAVYAIHALAVKVFPRQAHPVERMLATDFSLLAAGISLLGAVVLAPIVEELAFRGVLQGWLVRVSREVTGGEGGDPPSEGGSIRGALPGIVLASSFFAAIHVQQWPAPIPLFLLAMVMGLMKERTGSLLTAIVIHALFNATSTFGMLFMQLGGVDVPGPPPPEAVADWLGRLAAMFG
jgi:membrane protease YdiL (CAAX protease family)